jgi:cytochrome c oxidase subunit 2
MKKIIGIFVVILALMEGVSWWVYKSLSSKNTDESSQSSEETQMSTTPSNSSVSQRPIEKTENSPSSSNQTSIVPGAPSVALPPKGTVSDFTSFPPPSTEVVNGRTERTIHMGVRQYVWEPATITAKKGELVRLIIHNADVLHGLVIPDLGVNQDVPPDGAVVEFMASKTGTFEFFCSIWCGEGHMEMRGSIVIQ